MSSRSKCLKTGAVASPAAVTCLGWKNRNRPRGCCSCCSCCLCCRRYFVVVIVVAGCGFPQELGSPLFVLKTFAVVVERNYLPVNNRYTVAHPAVCGPIRAATTQAPTLHTISWAKPHGSRARSLGTLCQFLNSRSTAPNKPFLATAITGEHCK